MTLDFECHSKDMDDKTANLMETARTLFGEIWSYVPNVENVPDEIQQKFVFIGIDKAVMALCRANESHDVVCLGARYQAEKN
jgi:hypothetical protein